MKRSGVGGKSQPNPNTEVRRDSILHYTEDQWRAEGERRFGRDMMKWRFVCPICGNIASCEDFRQYADKGATPNSATCECIGRYTGAKDSFDKNVKPCKYAGYGLFRLSPIRIDRGDVETHCFAFAETATETRTTHPNPADQPDSTTKES
jgi:hypothetical protein